MKNYIEATEKIKKTKATKMFSVFTELYDISIALHCWWPAFRENMSKIQ